MDVLLAGKRGDIGPEKRPAAIAARDRTAAAANRVRKRGRAAVGVDRDMTFVALVIDATRFVPQSRPRVFIAANVDQIEDTMVMVDVARTERCCGE